MIKIKKFTFNPFQENTYLLINEEKDCIVVDPGCFNRNEESELSSYIETNNLNPTMLINTHAHIDHVLGNHFVANQYQLGLSIFQSEYPMLEMAIRSSEMYGIPYTPSPDPQFFLKDGDTIEFGNTSFDVLHVPGHAPDHIVLINENENIMIGGDVLFKQSIGRTDLPGGNHKDLIQNIKTKIFPLKESIVVYSGHGPETTIGEEKNNNPFF